MLSRHSVLLESKLDTLNIFIFICRGYVVDDLDCSHYMKDYYAKPVPIRNPKAKALLAHIE